MRQGMTRREMIGAGALLAGSVCGCRAGGESVAPRSTCCSTPDLEPESVTYGPGGLTIDLLKAPSLREIGSAAYVVNEARSLQLIVVHAGKNAYCVLSRLCTHGRQVISYNRRRSVLQCNNFNHSIFLLDGRVWKGPAEKPLKSYGVVLVEDALVISV
jgi:nitrite reductase/ring-hydroxylating ferredoxin subunit